MDFSSTPRSLRDVLGHFFEIPRYQRPYSWTKEEIEELWEDAVQERPKAYFIGSMVVYPGKDNALAVIDGQQRLTTLTMMLAAIRDEADELGHAALANGTHNFLERRDENDTLRSVLTGPSYPYLQDVVLSRGTPQLPPPKSREYANIVEGATRIRELVHGAVRDILGDTSLTERRRANATRKKLQAIRDQLLDVQLVFIRVSNIDDATTVFVTMNARGRDLTPADLVKAHLLSVLPGGAVDSAFVRWQAIEAKFDASSERISMTPFLLASYRSRHGNTTAANLSRAIKAVVPRDKAKAEAYLRELEVDAEVYRALNDPEYRAWPFEAKDMPWRLRFFRDEGIAQPMPMLLSLLRAYDDGLIKLPALLQALRAVEDYYFTFTKIGGRSSSGGVSSTFYRRAQELLVAKDSNTRAVILRDLRSYLRSRRPTDEEFDEAFHRLWFTTDKASDKKRVQYVLRRMYQHEHPRSGVDFAQYTIEHLKPQSQGGDFVGRLGNLILVSETLNGKLGDLPFADKLERLRAQPTVAIPKDVLQAESWDDAEIVSRTQRIAEFGRTKVWTG